MIRNPSTRLLLALIAVVLVSWGCKQDQSATGESAQNAMGLYAKGFNALLDGPRDMAKEYEDNVPDEGPDESKKYRLFPRQNSARRQVEEATQAFAEAKKSAPASIAQIAPLAAAALAATLTLEKDFTEAQKYYEAENWKDDKFAKGKELHGRLVTEIKAFRDALDALSNELSRVEDAQAEVEIKKYGTTSPRYWFRFVNMKAKKLLSFAEKGPGPTFVKDFEAALAEFDAAREDTTKFLDAKGSGFGPGVLQTYKGYMSATDRLSASAVKAKRAAAEAVQDPEKIEEFHREFNTMVSSYNSVVSVTDGLYSLESNDLLK